VALSLFDLRSEILLITAIAALVTIIGIDQFRRIPYTIKAEQPTVLINRSVRMSFIRNDTNTKKDAI
jgi:hypothetical protein